MPVSDSLFSFDQQAGVTSCILGCQICKCIPKRYRYSLKPTRANSSGLSQHGGDHQYGDDVLHSCRPRMSEERRYNSRLLTGKAAPMGYSSWLLAQKEKKRTTQANTKVTLRWFAVMIGAFMQPATKLERRLLVTDYSETNRLFKSDLFLLGSFRRFQEGQKLANDHTCTSSDQAQSLVEMFSWRSGVTFCWPCCWLGAACDSAKRWIVVMPVFVNFRWSARWPEEKARMHKNKRKPIAETNPEHHAINDETTPSINPTTRTLI